MLAKELPLDYGSFGCEWLRLSISADVDEWDITARFDHGCLASVYRNWL